MLLPVVTAIFFFFVGLFVGLFLGLFVVGLFFGLLVVGLLIFFFVGVIVSSSPSTFFAVEVVVVFFFGLVVFLILFGELLFRSFDDGFVEDFGVSDDLLVVDRVDLVEGDDKNKDCVLDGFADFGVLIDDLADRVDGVDGDDASHESVLDGFTDFGVLSVDLVVDRADRMEGDEDTTVLVVAGSSLFLSSSSSFLSAVLEPLPVRRYNLSRSILFFDDIAEGLSETDRVVVFDCEALEEEEEEELDVKLLSVTVVELDLGDFLSFSLFFFFDFLVGLLLLLLSVASDVRSIVRSTDFVTDSRTADFRIRRSLSFSSKSFRLFRADCGVEWAET
mmetsp:Transcript_13260/g.32377  ORF Transcript_13260/g.32377 Transcript_13260/m.32377 type:complete len:333 (+) Transcript_13260:1756-2754(+)